MTLKEIMSALKKLGMAQNRELYQRHGSGDNVFGVSFGELRPFAKKIGTDHQLAERIGRVEVDQGETGCRTPDAASYIRKAISR